MITVTKQENGVLFTFQDSDKYLYGSGTILVPFNSLSIVADESDMITLKKAASNDVFLSARYDTDFGYRSKDDAIDDLKDMLFAETGGSGSGVTPSEVQTMIDNSLEDYYTDDEVDAALSGKASVSDVTALENEVATKADTSAVTAVASDVSTLSGQVATKVAITDFNAYSAATDSRLAEDEEVTAAALNNLDENKQDALEYYSEDTTVNTATIHIENTDDGTVGEVYVDGASVDISALRTEEDEDNGSMVETHSDINGNNAGIAMSYEKLIDGEEATHSYLNVNEGLISMEIMSNEETTNVDVYSTGVTINGDAVATEPYVDDVISGKVDTSAITSAITSASTNDEVAGAKAVYDAIQAGGGGGATYSAGTNISIDTANTINCTLPITAGTNELTINTKQIKIGTQATGMTNGFSFAMGDSAKASQHYTFAAGMFVEAKGYCSQSFGQRVYSNNHNEFSCGKFNDSVTGSTASGQTLFSVGNGENYTTNKHNALEIRQNGDIYFPDTDNTTYQNDYQKPMVRLQDMYGALGGLKLVQCTQAEYDALVIGGTVDANTLYIINNVV